MRDSDAYITYIQNFFTRWVGLYDYFSSSIFYAYRDASQTMCNELNAVNGKTVLDLCTGTAEVALRLAASGFKVTGVDITQAMLDRARHKARKRKLDIDFLQGDARSLSFSEESFDGVVISFALHDMPRPVRVQVLSEAARVCKTIDGEKHLVVLDYELPSGRSLNRFWFWFISLFESPYFPGFVRDDFQQLFREAGLIICEKKRLFPGVFSIYSLRAAN